MHRKDAADDSDPTPDDDDEPTAKIRDAAGRFVLDVCPFITKSFFLTPLDSTIATWSAAQLTANRTAMQQHQLKQLINMGVTELNLAIERKQLSSKFISKVTFHADTESNCANIFLHHLY
jgi:hypothetical protein